MECSDFVFEKRLTKVGSQLNLFFSVHGESHEHMTGIGEHWLFAI